MSERRPYLRPQRKDWWAHPPYAAYTQRELSGVALAIYAAILLIGLFCLSRGRESFEGYRQFLAGPISLLLHLALLLVAIYHTRTWFKILPKTLPKIVWHGRLVPQAQITSIALLVAGGCSALLLAVAVVAGAKS